MQDSIVARRRRAVAFFVMALAGVIVPPLVPLPLEQGFVDVFIFTGRMLGITCTGAGIGSWFGYGWCGAALALGPALLVRLFS